jgi:hypothetical protein
MKKIVLATMLALSGLTGAAILAPQAAEAHGWYRGGGYGGWHHGGGYGGWHRPWYGPGPRVAFAYGGPAYYGPACWWTRRWVDTPWGPQMRRMRVCR